MIDQAPIKIKKILVANRSEIAIRIFRAANELGLGTAAIYSEQDRLALHRFKADESYKIGHKKGPVEAYLSIDEIIKAALGCGADAIHPGYGLLSENPDFADACVKAGLVFIGPSGEVMRQLGDKIAARKLAIAANVPVMPASEILPEDDAEIARLAEAIGFPLMIKASWGGGGRGMRMIHHASELQSQVMAARREAQAAFGKGDVYLEKLVQAARHIEVQLIGDQHGNLVHLFERDCSIQRRHQKIVERAPAPFLSPDQRRQLCAYATAIGRLANYENAGTVEFLMDMESEEIYFIEVNPRIQVEHTVSEEVTGIDIVKAQIRIAAGGRIGEAASGVPAQEDIQLNGHALQCRITTEDPEQNFIPDYGRITAYRGATGFGIRLDGGTAYSGAVITRYYDPLLEKVTAWAPGPQEAARRMRRALREFRIRGVATNLTFLENIVSHPHFLDCRYTTRFVDDTEELFEQVARKDRATKILNYIAEITVNGHPEMLTRERPRRRPAEPRTAHLTSAPIGTSARTPSSVEGSRQKLERLGPASFARWIRDHPHLLVTDTTMRDAHQSLLATRMRSFDIAAIAPVYAHRLPQLFSLECWGGATFDVAMRFLNEDPWQRLRDIRQKAPNQLLQMLFRGANGVGYANYPDNVVRDFVQKSAAAGIDLFRIFDCLNWIENMRVAIDAVVETGKLCEGAICYTGDICDSARTKFDLAYYKKLAKALENAGCHILCIKDMAGLVKPNAARILFSELRDTVDIPIHFHTHDTSGFAAASLYCAVEAGCDIVDAAMDSLSGLTSQPCIGSLCAALKDTAHDPQLDLDAINEISDYWESVRSLYSAFDSEMKAGSSSVYIHEMPGGQYTNLKEQARSLGLEHRWQEIAYQYRNVNEMFGDIVKVTPSSKVVGDMALMMITQNLTPEDVLDPNREIAFPQSVVQLMSGDLGQPEGGFPQGIQRKVLKGAAPITVRPGGLLKDVDFGAESKSLSERIGRDPTQEELASYFMYPKITTDFIAFQDKYGPVGNLPSWTYFYGMEAGEEISVELEIGKTLIITCLAIGQPDDQGRVRVFFELNGQPRIAKITDRSHGQAAENVRPKANADDSRQIGSPLPGMVSSVHVEKGGKVRSGDVLVTIEAMKMETIIHSDNDGVITDLLVAAGDQVDAKDLLVIVE